MVDDSKKKVKDAVGKHLIGEFPLDTPVATPKSKGGRKRKTTDDDEGTPTPTPKKRASRAKATPKKLPVDDDSDSGTFMLFGTCQSTNLSQLQERIMSRMSMSRKRRIEC